MQIRDVMSMNVTRVGVQSSLKRAAELVSLSQASDLMVVDDENNFVGVLSEGDLIRAVLPDFDDMIEQGKDTALAFANFVETGLQFGAKPIVPFVIKDPITLSPEDAALRAATVMISKQIRRLPVVEKGKLVGTVSRADICRAVLAGE